MTRSIANLTARSPDRPDVDRFYIKDPAGLLTPTARGR